VTGWRSGGQLCPQELSSESWKSGLSWKQCVLESVSLDFQAIFNPLQMLLFCLVKTLWS
jgi:hypothetical protein